MKAKKYMITILLLSFLTSIVASVTEGTFEGTVDGPTSPSSENTGIGTLTQDGTNPSSGNSPIGEHSPDGTNPFFGNSGIGNEAPDDTNIEPPEEDSESTKENKVEYFCGCGSPVSGMFMSCSRCTMENGFVSKLVSFTNNLDNIKNTLKDQTEGVNLEYSNVTDLIAVEESIKEEVENLNELETQTENEHQEIIQENNEQTESYETTNIAQTTGDPVRIFNGEFLQYDYDFATKSFVFNRYYSSYNKMEGSFGLGIYSILDEGIIRSVEPNLNKLIELYDEQMNKYNEEINFIKETICNLFPINQFSEATDYILKILNIFEQNISTLETELINLTQVVEDSKISSSYNKFVDLYEEEKNYLQELNEKKIQYESLKNYIESLIIKIEDINLLIEKAKKKKESIVIKQEENLKIRNENERANLTNVPEYMIFSGDNMLTLLEGDSSIKRFILHDEATNENVWFLLNIDNSVNKSERIIISQDNYTYYRRNGEVKTYNKAGFLISIKDINGNETIFVRNNENKVEKVKTREGQEYIIFYENSKYVTEIKNINSEKKYNYFYEGNKLVKVINSENLVYEYFYDKENGLLCKFLKPDGKYTAYYHDEKKINGEVLTTSTENEEGFREKFDFYLEKNLTVYTDHDGRQTIYYFNNNGKIIKQEDSKKNVIENTYDSKGNLVLQKYNGNTFEYLYDKNQNLIKTITIEKLSNGKTQTAIEQYDYDCFGNIIKYINADGIIFEFERDSRGNLLKYKKNGSILISFNYNDFGLVTKIQELIDDYDNLYKITQYTYDDCQNIIEEKIGNKILSYKYDDENRVTQIYVNDILEKEIIYTDFTELVKNKMGLETLYKYNNRFDVVEKIEKDVILNQCHITKYTYDSRHLLVEQIEYLDCGIQSEKTEFAKTENKYSKFGVLEATISTSTNSKQGFYVIYKRLGNILEVTNGVFDVKELKSKYSYLFEKKLRDWTDQDFAVLLSNSQSKKIEIQEYLSNENAFLIKDALGRKDFYDYNVRNQLESVIKFDRNNNETEEINYNYSKGGLLTGYTNQFGGSISIEYDDEGLVKSSKTSYGKNNYSYTKSGLIRSVTDGEGFKTVYSYNSEGLLESKKSYNKSVFYIYDDFNRIVQEIHGEKPDIKTALSFSTIEYSKDNRKALINQGNQIFTEVFFDGFGNIIKTVNGEGATKRYEYNGLNQLVASYDGYGNKTEYVYNPLGIIEKVTYPDLTYEEYSYNESGLVVKIQNPLGVSAYYQYDEGNRLIKEKLPAREEKIYEYDSFDRLISVKINDTVVEEYEYFDNGKTILFRDGNAVSNYDKVVSKIDSFGHLVQETNSLGMTENYSYNKNGEYASTLDYNNNVKSLTKVVNPNGYEEIIKYQDGTTKNLTYDINGRIIRERSLYSLNEYKYNQADLLTVHTNLLSNETSTYSYDKAGRKIRICNSKQKILYKYGANNEIISLEDSHNQIRIDFMYDKVGREVSRVLSNGKKEVYDFDEAGRLLYQFIEDSNKNILYSQAYYYDKKGYIRGTVNHLGQVYLYEYDLFGQLSAVYSPITEDLINAQKTEIKENGGKIVEKEELLARKRYFTREEISVLQSLLNKIQIGRGRIINSFTYFNVELYGYDKSGNRVSKENPFGKIRYYYDTENRLLGSSARGEISDSEYYINYQYDDNGNLLKEFSPQKDISYTYNLDNRIETVVVIDNLKKTKSEESYYYDSFGRRILENKNNISKTYDYEGFSFNVLLEKTISNSSDALFYKQSGNTANGFRYRNIDKQSVSISTRAYFYKKDDLVALGDNNSSVFYTRDIYGTTRYVTDSNGFSESYNYDSFGKPIFKDGYVTYEEGYELDTLTCNAIYYSDGNSFDIIFDSSEVETSSNNLYNAYLAVSGYSGKSYNFSTGLNNYGFRDYSSSVGRFITVDPVKDGTNWYTIARNNPINFIDLWGLCTENKDRKVYETKYPEACPVGPYVNFSYENLTSDFGYRDNPVTGEEGSYHNGLDFGIPVGTEILATYDGVIIEVLYDDPIYGNAIKIDHNDTNNTFYAHLSEVYVSVGDIVEKATVIGLSGGSPGTEGAGMSTGPHLHFEQINDNQAVDPMYSMFGLLFEVIEN